MSHCDDAKQLEIDGSLSSEVYVRACWPLVSVCVGRMRGKSAELL